MNILSAENISYSVTGADGKIDILRNISFKINKGDIVGITGESGSGKTTLAKIAAGHLEPTAGTLRINLEKESPANPIQLLYQNSGYIINPFRKVFDIVSEASSIRVKEKVKAEENAEKILSLLGAGSGLWNKRGYELSGGERQRAALARILAVHPKLLILDEPFAAQDVESQLNMTSLLNKIMGEFDLTILCISHNIKILRKFAGTILTMKKGELYLHETIQGEAL